MNRETNLNKSQTYWQRLDVMNDEDIDLCHCTEITSNLSTKATVNIGLPIAQTQLVWLRRMLRDDR
ncbi:hypothetical protein NIES37_61860 [Tolypothrix tenuis PCC 7101]|uniref:Uncharacterized protein n=1 Tax=Tolypothrix tenuis PCC 7101 TaxID=231146 RepID=A0A1Z4N913_9CYAN|nr:hypothetical protein [Aulosira sp. FACHB-113]BAZ02175.1 hypothetical protein NIES37_61860 [Tolypothrix tenuis PCC 7101]BAZ73904.1 hypothetical protein NIES50_24710 [Aulosira laxa NIES-50]